ncbi:MAG: hypothetical protein P8X52_08015 [Limibacillus sp.]
MQLGRLAAFPPGEAREDWTILRAFSPLTGKALPYDSLGELRQHMIEVNPLFAAIDQVPKAAWEAFGMDGKIASEAFDLPIENFYMTDPISRASETMAACSEAFVWNKGEATGTDG